MPKRSRNGTPLQALTLPQAGCHLLPLMNRLVVLASVPSVATVLLEAVKVKSVQLFLVCIIFVACLQGRPQRASQ